MTLPDEFYYYDDSEALFANPKSVGVRKLGTVASVSCQILESTRGRQGLVRDRRVGGGEGGGERGGEGEEEEDSMDDVGGGEDGRPCDSGGDGDDCGNTSTLPRKRRVIACSFRMVSPCAGVQQV